MGRLPGPNYALEVVLANRYGHRRLAPTVSDRENPVMAPETRYATSGEVSIAYQVVGDGPFDIVFVPGFVSNVELGWNIPSRAALYDRLASFSRLIIFDKRGTGMSDPVVGAPTLETRMDDVRAVMDAVGSSEAAVIGLSEGAPLTMLFAATYPERTSAIVLIGGFARLLWAPDHPWGQTEEEYRQEAELDLQILGPREEAYRAMRAFMDDEDEVRSFVELYRQSTSPGAMRALHRMNKEIDVRDVVPAIRVPTLIVHGECDHVPVEGARWLAAQIPGARMLELPGARHIPLGEDLERSAAEIKTFLEGVREIGGRDSEPDRVLATVLFSDIVGSSELAAELGDRAWRKLLERHHELVRRELVHHRGREVDTAGDGFFASFDGPARGIRCACAIVDHVRSLGVELRLGLHTGECEVVDRKVAGIAVHIGARVASSAEAGEVLVSSTVKDLVAGSGIRFEDRGVRELKGIAGAWQLYAVDRSSAA
jgi:pimeloyl-ACP methyl ester carboxylesterase